MAGSLAPSVEIVALPDVSTLMCAADTLRKLLGNAEDNGDIALDFPGSVMRYTGALVDVHGNLLAARDKCTPGSREQYLACIGDTAIGMAMASSEADKPDVFEPACANVSLFVCRPYRGQGVGKLLMAACLRSVQTNFDRHAWTAVRAENEASARLVTGAGFEPVGECPAGWENRNLFHYRAA